MYEYCALTVLQRTHSDPFVHGVNLLWLKNLISLGTRVLFFPFCTIIIIIIIFITKADCLELLLQSSLPLPFRHSSRTTFSRPEGKGALGWGGLLVPFSVSPPAVPDAGAAAPNHLNSR